MSKQPETLPEFEELLLRASERALGPSGSTGPAPRPAGAACRSHAGSACASCPASDLDYDTEVRLKNEVLAAYWKARRLPGELREAALAAELARAARPLGLEELACAIDQAQIGRDLLVDQIGPVVMLERIEERMQRAARQELRQAFSQQAKVFVILDAIAQLLPADRVHRAPRCTG